MGTAFSRRLRADLPFGSSKLMIHVTTGDKKGAGTDANVWITLYDAEGNSTKAQKLDRILKNDHERGQTDSFRVSPKTHMEEVVKVEFWRDSMGLADWWFVDRVEVEHTEKDVRFYFPVQRWIKPNTRYTIHQFDCFLPQDDPHPETRREEIAHKATLYRHVQKVPGGPAQIDVLPDDEQFSEKYFWTFVRQKAKLLLQMQFIKWTTDSWTSVDDLKSVFLHEHSLGHPQCLSCWNEDLWFGLQRVQGVNPTLITLCTHIPDKLGVTSEMVSPFLEGRTLEEALEDKKIFIIDLQILEGIQHKEGVELCTPIALLFLNKEEDLMPVAIQLKQEKGPENPVFLPSDPPNTWLLAKMFYNNAECQYHQACAHLGYTHLLMEGVCVSTHRQLSPSHPIFKLMAPHFLYLLAINARGLEKLVCRDGWVDKVMTIGVDGMFQLIGQGFDVWHLQALGIIPHEIEARGVLDPAVLPNYPYRDDALQLYAAIRNYVSKVVKHFYDDPAKIKEDHELQAWRSELVKPREEGGVGMLGVPGDDSQGFTSVDHIVDMVTVVVYQCSVGHAATNFQQYEAYGFVPNYPGILFGEVPKDKTAISDEKLLSYLPNKDITLDIMVITNLLSMKGTRSLGDFEVNYMYHPVGVQAAKEFREEIAEISQNIHKKNLERKHKYTWLDPAVIPNSISI